MTPANIPCHNSNSSNSPDLTVVSVLTSLILAVVMGAANIYLGLRAGMTVSASIPAAVMATALLRGVFRRRSIFEANIVQTGASAGESLAAGIIFTVPALVLTHVWSSFNFWETFTIAVAGGLLGVLMMIPMRRPIVVEAAELRFPEGVACAEVLRAGEVTPDSPAGTGGSRLIFVGLLVGAVTKIATILRLLEPATQYATRSLGRTWYFGLDNSPALLGVGLIVGLPIAAQVSLGGAIGWYVLLPMLSSSSVELSPSEHAFAIWSSQVRYVGVGAMLVGGVSAIWNVRGGIAGAVQEMTAQLHKKEDDSKDASSQSLSFRMIVPMAFMCSVAIFLLYLQLLQRSLPITLLATMAALILSFFFTAVSSYIVGLVGNSNNPVSGMTITAVLLTGGFLFLAGYTGEMGVVAMLGMASVVCCVACTAGDVCNDLKTGQIIGASPRSQQIIQLLCVLVSAFVMSPIMSVLHEGSLRSGGGGIGGTDLPAPQAQLFASLANGFFGACTIPWDKISWGVGLGIFILIMNSLLPRKWAALRMHVMPIAVGLYLPIELASTIFIGGLLNWLVRRSATKTIPTEQRLLLLASGIIAGESLTGVLGGILSYLQVQTGGFFEPNFLTAPLVLGTIVLVIWAISRR